MSKAKGQGLRLDGQISVVDDKGRVAGVLENPKIKFLWTEKEQIQAFVSTESYLALSRDIDECLENPSTEKAEEQVFAHWRKAFGKTAQTKFTLERRKRVRARLEKRDADYICRAIDHVAASRHHVDNGHVGLDLICRSDEKLEWYHDSLPLQSRPRGNTLESRDRAIVDARIGADERRKHAAIINLVRTLIFPPQPGEIDMFTDQPVLQPAEARERLRDLVEDVDATVDKYRPEVHAERLRARRSA